MRETLALYVDTLLEVVESGDPPGLSYKEVMTVPDDEYEDDDISPDTILEEDAKQNCLDR
jgi:hypothetical protein